MKNDRYSCKDRVTGAVCDDERSDNTPLAFLYGSGSLSRLARRLARRPFLSKLIGWKYNRPAAPKHLRRFVEQWGIDMAEAELPIEGYATINDLFARRLKPGVRPIDCSPNALVSAADARALVFPSLEGIHLPVKNGNYSIATLIEDEHAAQRFADGAAAVLRLAPGIITVSIFLRTGLPVNRAGYRVCSIPWRRRRSRGIPNSSAATSAMSSCSAAINVAPSRSSPSVLSASAPSSTPIFPGPSNAGRSRAISSSADRLL